MHPYAFISYSRKDEEILDKLISRLGEENVFTDKLNVEEGELLPYKLSKGIQDSNWFVLLASKNSMKSKWVQYEVNQAIINWIEKRNYDIVVVKIDECELFPELKPFNYIDLPTNTEEAIERIVQFILNKGEGKIPVQKKWKRKVVNRYNELGDIEDLANEGINFIFLWGLFGIGKTTLVEYAANQIFNAGFIRFPLTDGHNLLRLSLELAGESNNDLPAPDASEDELLNSAVDSIIKLINKRNIILFDDFERTLDENGNIPEYIEEIIKKLQSHNPEFPLFFASSQRPNINDMDSHIMKIGALSDIHTTYILENWIKLAGSEEVDRDRLKRLVPNLHGYPLAARLAAYSVVRYSVDTILEDTKFFEELKIDIAKKLIGRVSSEITKLESNCLEVLTIADSGLTLEELCDVLGEDIDELREVTRKLVDSLLVFYEKGKLQIIPLIKDYFWYRASSKGAWKEFAEKLTDEIAFKVRGSDTDSRNFVHYSSMYYRLLLLLGRHGEARELRYQYEGELRGAVQRLYNIRNYPLALEYATLWLKINEKDNQIRWYRARCLTRLGDYENAKKELKYLEKVKFKPFKLNHAFGLLYRDQKD